MRSGLKSLASILVETSIAKTMSMPSVSTFSMSLDERGRHMARIRAVRARILNTKGRWTSQLYTVPPDAFQGAREDTLICGRLPRSPR